MFGGVSSFLISIFFLSLAQAQDVSVEWVSHKTGIMTDMNTYIVRGASLRDVAKALKIVKIRESSTGSMNKVAEHDFDSVTSVALVRPLSVPTGVVIKHEEGYFGAGIFGPVWGHFEVEAGDGFVVVKDFVGGSPIFRFGHHTFADGALAISRAIARVRANPNICEPVL